MRDGLVRCPTGVNKAVRKRIERRAEGRAGKESGPVSSTVSSAPSGCSVGALFEFWRCFPCVFVIGSAVRKNKMTESTDNGESGAVKMPGQDDRHAEHHPTRIVRVLTVVAYICSVSMAAVMLSLY